MLGQRGAERVGLQALDDEQGVQRARRVRLEQHVGRVVGVAGPGHGDARQGALQPQRAVARRRQRVAGALGPVGAQRRRQAGGHLGQLRGLLHQRRRQQRALRPQPGALQQRGGRQQVAPAVEAQVIGRGLEHAHAPGPAARGLEARREAVRVGLGPQARRQRQQLRERQQHHAARRVGRQLAQLAVHLGQQRAPRLGLGVGAHGWIAGSYCIHSNLRCRGAKGGERLSVTIRPTLSAWITPVFQGCPDGQ